MRIRGTSSGGPSYERRLPRLADFVAPARAGKRGCAVSLRARFAISTAAKPASQAGSIDRLLERVARQDAKNHGNARVHLRELHAARDLGANIFVVRRFAAQDATDGDHGVGTAALCDFLRGKRNLERAGHAHDLDRVLSRARRPQCVQCARQQPLRDEAVESRDDDSEAKSRGRCGPARFPWLECFVHSESLRSRCVIFHEIARDAFRETPACPRENPPLRPKRRTTQPRDAALPLAAFRSRVRSLP